MLLRSTAPHVNKYSLKAYTERKKTKRKNIKCPKSKFYRICPQGELPQREERLRKTCFMILCILSFRVEYTERRKTKRKKGKCF